MNILIVSDNFTKGGLETHIATYYKELKKDNNLYFCFGTYNDTGILPGAIIYEDYHFNYDVTIKEFVDDVKRLVDIIEEKNIDLIHVHPFYAFYQAIFAAQLTKTKLIYSYHGTLSLSFSLNMIDEVLFEYAFETTISAVHGVSTRAIETSKLIPFERTKLIPNPIDMEEYKETKINNNKKWAIVSRLDYDKAGAITRLFNMLDEIDIEEIDVYGDGTEREKLEEVARNVSKKITFKGFTSSVNTDLLDAYNGVIGVGRVALEGLAMGFPVILAGNDKICGIINKEMYDKAKLYNFIGKDFNDVSIDELKLQLNDVYSNIFSYNLREFVKEDFDIKNISKKYFEDINTLPEFIQNQTMLDIFNDLDKYDLNCKFHQSNFMLELLNKYVLYNTRNLFIKNKIMIMNKQKEDYDNMQNKINESNNSLKELNILMLDKAKEDIYIEVNKCLTDKYNDLMNKHNQLIDDLEEAKNENIKLKEEVESIKAEVNSKWIIRNDVKKIISKLKK